MRSRFRHSHVTGGLYRVFTRLIFWRERVLAMKLTEFFREQLDREVERSRKALEQVPDGKYDWKPHERSMIFGYLADMVATIPTWITMEIKRTIWMWRRLKVKAPKRRRRRRVRI